MRILIVEDEKRLSAAIEEILIKQKYNVDTVFNGMDGYEYAKTGVYDLIILDWMLPLMDGITILNNLKKEQIKTPILLLTAKDHLNDKINGLDSGADDYMTKPFETLELLARIRVLLRRQNDNFENILTYSDITLNLETCELITSENNIKLGLKEFYIMELLLKNPKQVITKEVFIQKVWGFDTDVEYNNVEVYISFLRKKLNFINSKVLINTTRGLGYALGENND